MSFFGLTAFGPENLIKSSLTNSNCFTLYSEEEFFDGFKYILETYNYENSIKMVQLSEFFTKTFGFVALEDEINCKYNFSFNSNLIVFKTVASKTDTDELNWDEFLETLYKIRGNLSL